MNLAFLMTVCDGEEAIAWDTLLSLAHACQGASIWLFLVDDASSTHIGQRLAERFAALTGHRAECQELPKKLGFYGTAMRLFRGLARVNRSGHRFDMVVKLDADACIVRQDLLPFLRQACPQGVGFFGELYPMRTRDKTLLLADFLPLGFSRAREGDVITRKWKPGRLRPVWWSDLGWRALLRGFRMQFVAGGFCVIGGQTLARLDQVGWLERDQSHSGFVFADDLLLTIAVHALGDPVIDLRSLSPHWGYLATTEDHPIEPLVQAKPYVVHHLKDRPKAWLRRRQLREFFGWPALPDLPAAARAAPPTP